MPPDIRSFFGGKVSAPIREKETKKEDDSKKKRGSKKLDSTDLFMPANSSRKQKGHRR
jgi:replication factor C subunit 1